MYRKFFNALVLAGLCVATPAAAVPTAETAEVGFRVPTEYVQLNRDYTRYLSRIAHFDHGSGELVLDNGSRWQMQFFDGPGFMRLINQWQTGDIVGFAGRSFGPEPAYTLYNRSRNHNVEVKAHMVSPPEPEWPTFLVIESINMGDPTTGVHIVLSNGMDWWVPHEHALELTRWGHGEPIQLDIVEELSFESGILVIKEHLLFINLMNHRWLQFQDTDFRELDGFPPMMP